VPILSSHAATDIRATDHCAIDFGTSNSAVALPASAPGGKQQLVEIEPNHLTMPTAVFYHAEGRGTDGPPRAFGRAALAAYVEGIDGRLMRSMKSILGSSFVNQTTDVGGGRGMRYLDIIASTLRHLKQRAEAQAGHAVKRVVMGRPVYFVDDDAARDAQAQASLEEAARAVGFEDVQFQYEPIAAALDHEQSLLKEERVLVVDIGGGTSDFSVVRVGPERARRLDRKDDILANHGVHIAGTDFDRRIELCSVLREFGYGALGPSLKGQPAREVPAGVYFDLATWHLINTVYTPGRLAELRAMKPFYGNPLHHQRLMVVLEERLGHELAARAEQAKIDVSGGEAALIDLSHVERSLSVLLSEGDALQAIEADMARIAREAVQAVTLAGLQPGQIDTLYFTGGSTGLRVLAERIAAAFPDARVVRGDRFASVAMGLGVHASRLFDAG
jgi:hypothetical chaperone protein